MRRKDLVIGLPEDLRGEIWKHALGVLKLRRSASYANLKMFNPRRIIRGIVQDLPGTLPEEFELDQRLKLENMLIAYANFDKDIGYCHGTSSI